MRALVAGVIGSAASAAVWLAFENYMQASYGWLAILVGVVTGVCINKASGGATTGGTLRGALAVILALAGIVGGQKALAVYMQSQSVAGESVSMDSIKTDASAEGEDSGDTEAAETTATEPELVDLPEEQVPGGAGDYSKSALKKNMTDKDMIWMCVAALLAYVTGKGGEKAPAIVEENQGDAADDQPQASGEE